MYLFIMPQKLERKRFINIPFKQFRVRSYSDPQAYTKGVPIKTRLENHWVFKSKTPFADLGCKSTT